jgi:serine/threonine protein phosphatase PrpC
MATDEEEDDERRRLLASSLDVDTFRSLSSIVRVKLAARSDRGRVLPHNEDHYLAIRLCRSQETLVSSLEEADLPRRFEEYGYAMLVADGLGSGGAGGLASRLALSTLAHLALRYGKWNLRVGVEGLDEIEEQSEFFYRRINEIVFQVAGTDSRLSGMATSLTTVCTAGPELFFAHVGHSRAYVFREGVLIQLTNDHTLDQ